jgi:hypothetical protein
MDRAMSEAACASTALSVGFEVLTPHLRTPNALVAAKCIAMLCGYDARWQNSPYRIDEIEYVSTSELFNPATEAKSRTFTIAGKLDLLCTERSTGRKVLIDHKTAASSTDIEDFNAPYWRQLVVEGQVSHYFLLEWLNGRKVDFAVWDVCRKSGISPKGLAKKELAAVRDFGTYYAQGVTAEDQEELQATERETPLMFAARLIHDCTVERPHRYFQRRMVPRLDEEVHEYAVDLWENAQDVILSRRNKRWPRNSGACFNYSTPCQFLGICSGHDTDLSKWSRKEWVHPELPIIQTDGKDVLTNSCIRTYQTCKRRFYYRYELGIEKPDEEEKESLFFGHLFHQALEAYFTQQKKEGI